MSIAPETSADINSDPFVSYSSEWDPTEVLIAASPKTMKATYNFYEELVDAFPRAKFIKREKGRGFEVGRIVE